MSTDNSVVLARQGGRGLFYMLLLAAIGASLWLFRDTVATLVGTWNGSDTYAHGYLIAPIALWLIWQRHARLSMARVSPSLLGVLGLAGLGGVWLIAQLADLQVVTQIVLCLMVGAWVLTLAGWRYTRVIAFALLFLVLSVPMGEGLIEPLMVFTADFVVWSLNVLGIPVYREGMMFELPTGHWSVVKACSGIRYVIASITLGALFAYLNYRSPWRRLAFVALSVALPVVANAVRALMIVLIGHYSDMKLAVGVDHLLYGWVFFGIIMLLMFWIGSLWSEAPEPAQNAGAPVPAPQPDAPPGQIGLFFLLGLGLLVAVSTLGVRLGSAPVAELPETLPAPAGSAGWQASAAPQTLPWQLDFQNPDARWHWRYQQGEDWIGIYLPAYVTQRRDAELVNDNNRVLRVKDKRWNWYPKADKGLEIAGTPVTARGSVLHSRLGARLRVWRLRWIDGQWIQNPLRAKWLELLNSLRGRATPAAEVILYTPTQFQLQDADKRLRGFMSGHAERIGQALGAALQP